MDPDDNIAEAIAVEDGKIVAAASNQQILRLVGKDTKIIDLLGKVVLPGFYACPYRKFRPSLFTRVYV